MVYWSWIVDWGKCYILHQAHLLLSGGKALSMSLIASWVKSLGTDLSNVLRIAFFLPSSHLIRSLCPDWNRSQSKGDCGGGGKTSFFSSKLNLVLFQMVCKLFAQANEWDFDSASALNRFDHHGYSRTSLMEQFLKERKKQEQLENFDYDLKFLPYSAQVAVTWLPYLTIVFRLSGWDGFRRAVWAFGGSATSKAALVFWYSDIMIFWYSETSKSALVFWSSLFINQGDFQMMMRLKVRTQDLWNLA